MDVCVVVVLSLPGTSALFSRSFHSCHRGKGAGENARACRFFSFFLPAVFKREKHREGQNGRAREGVHDRCLSPSTAVCENAFREESEGGVEHCRACGI